MVRSNDITQILTKPCSFKLKNIKHKTTFALLWFTYYFKYERVLNMGQGTIMDGF